MENKVNINALNEINDTTFQYKIITEYFSDELNSKNANQILYDIASIWLNFYNQEVIENALKEVTYEFAIKIYKETKSIETVKNSLTSKQFDESDIPIAISKLQKLIKQATGKISRKKQTVSGLLILTINSFIIIFQREANRIMILSFLFMTISVIANYIFKRQQRRTAQKKLGIKKQK